MKFILDRQTFSKLKRCGYGEMSAFLNQLYIQAFRDGQDEGLTRREVYETIVGLKGLGPRTANKILDALDVRMDKEYNMKYICSSCNGDLTRYKEAKYCPHCGAELFRE